MTTPVTEFVTAAPAAQLAPMVAGYIGYRLLGHAPALHRGLPSTGMTFIVGIGRTIDIAVQTNPGDGPRSYHSVVAGLHTTNALIEHDGNQEGVAIQLTPLGCRALFGRPASALYDLSLELTDLTADPGDELWDRLQGARGWRERFAVCDDVLLRMLDMDAAAPDVGHAWSMIMAAGGHIRVAEVAASIGWSRQLLSRRFRDEFGVTPKTAARLSRFVRARRLLEVRPPLPPLAQVAAECGYFDQAHMSGDFQQLAGCTPTELIRGDVPLEHGIASPTG